MTDNHPITPPPELVDSWIANAGPDYEQDIATQAARWGANQELEACEKYWMTHGISPEGVARMREHRRPKPPSLKEQALEALGPEPLPERGPTGDTILNVGTIQRHHLIRRALESLPE